MFSEVTREIPKPLRVLPDRIFLPSFAVDEEIAPPVLTCVGSRVYFWNGPMRDGAGVPLLGSVIITVEYDVKVLCEQGISLH